MTTSRQAVLCSLALTMVAVSACGTTQSATRGQMAPEEHTLHPSLLVSAAPLPTKSVPPRPAGRSVRWQLVTKELDDQTLILQVSDPPCASSHTAQVTQNKSTSTITIWTAKPPADTEACTAEKRHALVKLVLTDHIGNHRLLHGSVTQ